MAFKLVIDVKDKQEEFMLKLDKRLRELSALDAKIDWLPILMEKAEHASSFSIKVSMRNTCIKIYDGKDLRDGKGWKFVKDLSFQNAKAKVAFAPVRVWEKDGKAGVALEATELVIQEFRGWLKRCKPANVLSILVIEPVCHELRGWLNVSLRLRS